MNSRTAHSTARPHSVLVLASDVEADRDLVQTICASARSDREARILVVAPALNTRLRHWASDTAAADAAARSRLVGIIGALAAAGVEANGIVGDADPARAAADALALFEPDEIILVGPPPQSANRLARGLLRHVQALYDGPIVDLVVAPRWPLGSPVASPPAAAANSHARRAVA